MRLKGWLLVSICLFAPSLVAAGELEPPELVKTVVAAAGGEDKGRSIN